MGIEIVKHYRDLVGLWEMHIGQVAQDVGKIDGGAPIANGDMAPAYQRRKENKQAGDTCAFILVVNPRLASRAVRQRRARLSVKNTGEDFPWQSGNRKRNAFRDRAV